MLDPTSTTYDGFADENEAMAFAESLDAANANPPATDLGNVDGTPP